jgi:hypothetical protein
LGITTIFLVYTPNILKKKRSKKRKKKEKRKKEKRKKEKRKKNGGRGGPRSRAC